MFVPDFTQVQQFWATWGKMAGAELSQLEKLSAELGKTRGEGVERAQQAIDESARLMKESLSYANELSTQWQKLALELTRQAAQAVRIPVIASGGAGKLADLADALDAGAHGVLAASIFHYKGSTLREARDYLRERGYVVRP